MRALPALLLVFVSRPAAAYEFEIDAQTVGQAYQLRSPRLDERDRVLERRRLTQTLGLDIWGILEPAYDAGRPDEPPLAPFDVYVSFSGRLLHDFGEYRSADVIHGTAPEPATSAVPELAGEDLALEVLWAQVGARGILGRVDVAFGRQLVVSELDWFAFDGLAVAARLPGHIAVEGQAGLLVRDDGPLGSPTQEPDGTSSAQCVAFVEGNEDLVPVGCRQRQQAAPTFGGALATHGLRWLSARVSYRRSVSRTADGLYLDSGGQAPSWGVLEEKLAASARARLLGGALVPWAAARWNFVLGLLDEADAGVRLTWRDHTLTPEARYSYPSFSGDSIFNVFATEPYWDARLTYDLWPGRGRVRAYARGFWRRFQNGERDLAPGESIASSAIAAGGGAGARLGLPGGVLRLDASYEDGYGGLRAGADLSARWRIARRLDLEARASLVRFEEDSLRDLRATSFSAQGGALVTLGPGMVLHVLAEENVNRFDDQLRLLAILDLAFRPEH